MKEREEERNGFGLEYCTNICHRDSKTGARPHFFVPQKGGSTYIIIRPDPDKFSFLLNINPHTPNFQNVIAEIDFN